MDEKKADGFTVKSKETDATVGAREQLLNWGVTEEEIKEISKAVEDLDYDSCEKKITRLVDTPCYQALVDNNLWITIPDYHDPVNRDDGVCEDLAKRFLIKLSNSGLLKKLSSRFDFFTTTGQSRTHFNTNDSIHVWIEMALMNADTNDRVIVDPSFNNIELYRVSGYQREKTSRDKANEQNLSYYPAEEIKVISKDDLIKYNQSSDGRLPYKVLGCSSDFQRIYSVGFCYDNPEDLHPKPYLQISFEDRNKPPISVTSSDGQLDLLFGNTNDLSQSAIDEATKISVLLQQLRIEANPEKATEASQRKVKFDLKY